MHPLSSAQLPSEYKVHHHPPPNPTIYTAKENSKVTQKSKPKYTFSAFLLSCFLAILHSAFFLSSFYGLFALFLSCFLAFNAFLSRAFLLSCFHAFFLSCCLAFLVSCSLDFLLLCAARNKEQEASGKKQVV